MQIILKMPARILAVPIVFFLAVALYLAFGVDGRYSMWIVPPLILLASIWVLSPQINWWWYQRYPPDVAAPIRQFLFQYPFYQRLPEGEKKRFRSRMALFVMGNEFIPQMMKDVPEDVKAIVAANAVTLTMGMEKFLFPKFENIIINPKPLPTLQYPEKYHASEIYEPDGVVLFSAEQLVRGFLESTRYFNIGLYEYAKVFRISNPVQFYPAFDENSWDAFERISGFSKEWIEQWINLPDIDPVAVSIVHFFTFPEEFLKELPEVYKMYRSIFKM